MRDTTATVRVAAPKRKTAAADSALAICGEPEYRHPSHSELPHIIKMSGGRSSAAMALSLARAGVLKPERGDVVLFANTTAEHPGTYEFAARVCDELEAEHDLACLWYEYCTVEVAAREGWARRAAYKLVKRTPARSDDPSHIPGYLADGSALETLASQRGMLPNKHLRMCTEHLKILPGAEIIAEWLSGSDGLAHAGHHHGKKLTSATKAFASYRGELKGYKFKRIKARAHKHPPSRPQQNWSDFTKVSRPSSGSKARPQADIWGQGGKPVQYVTLLGLRADEPRRLARMETQAMFSEGATRSACRDSARPAGELSYAPLGAWGATKQEVMEFWSQQSYDLEVDSAFGNCVFCFMKGEKAIGTLATTADDRRIEGTPTDIDWWANLEEKYARSAKKSRNSRFLFLSLSTPRSYKDIAADAREGAYELAIPPPPGWGCGSDALRLRGLSHGFETVLSRRQRAVERLGFRRSKEGVGLK